MRLSSNGLAMSATIIQNMKNLEQQNELTVEAKEATREEKTAMETISKAEVQTEVRSCYDEMNKVDSDYLFAGSEIPEEILKDYYDELSKEAISEEKFHQQYFEDDYEFERRYQVEEDQLVTRYTGEAWILGTQTLIKSLKQQKN